jgi:hypothetical protein
VEVGEAIEDKETCMIGRLYIRCMTGTNQNRIIYVHHGLVIVLSIFEVDCQLKRTEVCK